MCPVRPIPTSFDHVIGHRQAHLGACHHGVELLTGEDVQDRRKRAVAGGCAGVDQLKSPGNVGRRRHIWVAFPATLGVYDKLVTGQHLAGPLPGH